MNGMKKGKASLHKNAIFHGLLEGVAGELVIPMGPAADVSTSELMKQAKKLTGVREDEEIVLA